MTDFSLRTLVRDVLATSNEDHPALLAVEVFAKIPARDRAEALKQALREYVAVEITRARVTPGGHSLLDHHARSAAEGDAPAQNIRRSRAALSREGWRAALRDRIHAAAGTWRRLADCGENELLFAADELDTMAARNAAKAETYRTLAKYVAEEGVTSVAELPDTLLAEVLSSNSPTGGQSTSVTHPLSAAGRGEAA
jgi:hypothetical protein